MGHLEQVYRIFGYLKAQAHHDDELMMDIPCEECSFVYGDNQSILANTTTPESTLKKSQSTAYHSVRERASRDEWRTENPADLLTKPLPNGEK